MDRLVQRIRREGPVPFHVFMAEALYGPEGFYTAGGGAGRRRDFLTSPEVGPLFGAVVARALDVWWEGLGCPDPYVVVECGAGTGALAAGVLGAAPACATALRYVLVDSSAPMRAAQQRRRLPWAVPSQVLGSFGPESDDEHVEGLDDRVPRLGAGPLCASLGALPEVRAHVVLANELLDNVPFDVVLRAADGWQEVRIGHGETGFTEVLVPVTPALGAEADRLAPAAEPGVRIPIQHAATDWVRDALQRIGRGRLVVIDYAAATTATLGQRGDGWLRTFRDQQRAGSPLLDPGTADITADVAVDQLAGAARPHEVRTQADFLRAHGIDALVDEGRRTWEERAHLGDLQALTARSRAAEAAALLDPEGLGGFTVIEWVVP